MSTDPKKPIGFRRTERFGTTRIGWRAWVGPAIICRAHGFRRPSAWRSGDDWTFTALGISIGWAR